jgi:hypothetical protein
VNGEPAVPSLFDQARIRGFYVILALIVFLAITGAMRLAAPVDLGVFATLAGMDVAFIGAGSVIRFVGLK